MIVRAVFMEKSSGHLSIPTAPARWTDGDNLVSPSPEHLEARFTSRSLPLTMHERNMLLGWPTTDRHRPVRLPKCSAARVWTFTSEDIQQHLLLLTNRERAAEAQTQDEDATAGCRGQPPQFAAREKERKRRHSKNGWVEAGHGNAHLQLAFLLQTVPQRVAAPSICMEDLTTLHRVRRMAPCKGRSPSLHGLPWGADGASSSRGGLPRARPRARPAPTRRLGDGGRWADAAARRLAPLHEAMRIAIAVGAPRRTVATTAVAVASTLFGGRRRRRLAVRRPDRGEYSHLAPRRRLEPDPAARRCLHAIGGRVRTSAADAAGWR